MAKKQKYYVVWEGHMPGVYDSWEACQRQIKNYPNAKYKSFTTRKEAEKAITRPYRDYIETKKSSASKGISSTYRNEINFNSIAVDAACSGNPGDMEYRGVNTKTGQQYFHQGPFPEGTNNVGEFLALVHGIAWLQKIGKPRLPIYSDSKTAISWVKKKKAKTKLVKTKRNEQLFELITRAETWLQTHEYTNPILKWDTKRWGEIPADFGRK